MRSMIDWYLQPVLSYTNYVIVKHVATVSPHSMEELHQCSCLPGRNTQANLHIDHLNQLAKETITELASNKSIIQVSKSLGTIFPNLHQFDIECGMLDISGSHITATAEKDTTHFVHRVVQLYNSIQDGDRT